MSEPRVACHGSGGETPRSAQVRRRGLIAGAAALAAGLLAGRGASPVGATHQTEDVGLGLDNTVTNNQRTAIIAGPSLSSGSTVLFVADASPSSGDINGVFAKSSGGAAAMVGLGAGGTVGTTFSNSRAGVHGVGGTNSGTGVIGVGGPHSLGVIPGPGVVGIAGESPFTFVTNPIGVYGVANLTNGYGVLGINSLGLNTGAGVWGSGVTLGVLGTVGGTGTGVHGSSDSFSSPVAGAFGVQGRSTFGTGVYGETRASNQYGVLGTTYAATSTAIAGTCTQNGSSAFSGGTTNPNAFAGVFQGNVVIQGRLVVSDPSYKSGALLHPDGSHRLVYCVESPESWIEDFGEGTLTGGKAEIVLDKDFVAVVRTDHYHVFLTSHEPTSKGLAVAARHADRFAVAEHGGGTSNQTFSWRIVAKPKSSVKTERLGTFTMPNLPLPDPAKLAKSPAK